MNRDFKSQLFLDFSLSSIILIGLMILFHQTSIDEWVAGHFYSAKQSWIYRDNFFLEKIIHKGGVIFTIIILALLVLRWFYLNKDAGKKTDRDYVGFVVVSSLSTIIIVFLFKQWTTLPCPWNSLAFGGGSISPPLWQMFSTGLPHGHCFPGGHSSGGYALLSMYFGHIFVYGKRNFRALLPGIVMGVAFGIAQQMRGAHFISHDIATIFISIISSWLTSLFYSRYDHRYENKIIPN